MIDWQDAKERVRQATDIVELVGGYLQLRRQGRGYVGLCPWHDDTRPSMQVNPERQSFKCWVCDIGGDVFSFLMKMDGLEFREALETLADRAGIELAPASSAPRAEPGSPGDKKTLYAAMAWAESVYHRCLREAAEAAPARRYLAERGVNEESVERFKIGFAPPGWDWLLGRASNAGFSPAVLERVNLAAQRKSSDGWYDQFRGRLMFPIRDVRSRPIAFGGRVLPELVAAESRADYTPAKYVNSSETPIYSKSRELYALDLARDAIQEHDRAIVMEGYTDVVAAHQHGVAHAVAACGTALGEGHLKLLRRFTDNVTLVLDGDEAGRKRASELLELFVASPVDLRILTLPDQSDPCDFISSHGGDEFEALLATAPDALEHKLESVTAGMDSSADNVHQATRAVEQVLTTLAKTRAALGEATSAMLLREQGLLGRLARRFNLPEEGLRKRLADLRKTSGVKTVTRQDAAHHEGDAPAPLGKDLSVWEREALELMLCDTQHAERMIAELGEVDFDSNTGRRLFVLARTVSETGEASFDRLMLATDDEPLKALLVELDESGQERRESDAQQRLHDLLSAKADRQERARRRHHLTSLRQGELTESEADKTVADLFASRKGRETGRSSTEG